MKIKTMLPKHANFLNEDKFYPLLNDFCPQYISVNADIKIVLCRYFRSAVLPTDKELEEEIMQTKSGKECSCAICGRTFQKQGRAKYCSKECRKEAHRRASKASIRRIRLKAA